MSQTLGFIGLGVMGSGMCANLVRKSGAAVHVHDLAAEAVHAQVALGAQAAGGVSAVARAADVIFLSLPGGPQVQAVCSEIAEHAAPGTTVVDLSTTAVADARAAGEVLGARGIAFADAPVARARQAAIDGTLAIWVGAGGETFARIAPLLALIGNDVMRCGEVGCGQVVKLINNTLLFEHVAALAEMMVVAERSGVSAETLTAAVSLGSGDSFALRNHGAKAMAPRLFPEKAFPMEYVLKDMAPTIELARTAGVEPAMATRALAYYRAAIDSGINARYFPAIIELVEQGVAP